MLRDLDPGGSSGANPGGEFQKLLPGPARALLASPRVYRPLLRLERDLVAAAEERQPHWFDATLLISAGETAALRRRCDAAGIDTLPPLLREPAQVGRTPVERPVFTFLGGFDYAPNIDGLDWFLTHCRHEVLAAVPDVQINVIGFGTERGLPSADAWGDRVRFEGWVDDLDGRSAGHRRGRVVGVPRGADSRRAGRRHGSGPPGQHRTVHGGPQGLGHHLQPGSRETPLRRHIRTKYPIRGWPGGPPGPFLTNSDIQLAAGRQARAVPRDESHTPAKIHRRIPRPGSG
jgi:hypothetical protein